MRPSVVWHDGNLRIDSSVDQWGFSRRRFPVRRSTGGPGPPLHSPHRSRVAAVSRPRQRSHPRGAADRQRRGQRRRAQGRCRVPGRAGHTTGAEGDHPWIPGAGLGRLPSPRPRANPACRAAVDLGDKGTAGLEAHFDRQDVPFPPPGKVARHSRRRLTLPRLGASATGFPGDPHGPALLRARAQNTPQTAATGCRHRAAGRPVRIPFRTRRLKGCKRRHSTTQAKRTRRAPVLALATPSPRHPGS